MDHSHWQFPRFVVTFIVLSLSVAAGKCSYSPNMIIEVCDYGNGVAPSPLDAAISHTSTRDGTLFFCNGECFQLTMQALSADVEG